MATEVLWWIFAAAITGTALGVVTASSVIHSAIMLILALAGVGAMYVFLTVEFLALVQFLIYGGAVTVLILLALMLTRGGGTASEKLNGSQAPYALAVAASLLTILVSVGVATAWPGDAGDIPTTIGINAVSETLFMDFGVPFVIASAVLLVALVGAIILARQEEGE